jgi:hypothetical protein
VRFAAITALCCFSTSVYFCKHIFRYDSVRKLLDTSSYLLRSQEARSIRIAQDAVYCDFLSFHFLQPNAAIESKKQATVSTF